MRRWTLIDPATGERFYNQHMPLQSKWWMRGHLKELRRRMARVPTHTHYDEVMRLEVRRG